MNLILEPLNLPSQTPRFGSPDAFVRSVRIKPNDAFDLDSNRSWKESFGTVDFHSELLGISAPGSTFQKRENAASFSGEANLTPSLINRLNELASLQKGWDGGIASPVQTTAIFSATALLGFLCFQISNLPEPYIVATSDGFLQLEWHTKDRSLEFEFTTGGWSILGVALADSDKPIYNTAFVRHNNFSQMVSCYFWFASDDSLWPLK